MTLPLIAVPIDLRHGEERTKGPRLEPRNIAMPASWTYILKCADGSYYVGCTTNFDQRMSQHHAGSIRCYTQSRRPVELVWVAEYQTIHDAIATERKLKRWSHAKKTAFINGDVAALRSLSARRKPHVRGSRRAPPERSSP